MASLVCENSKEYGNDMVTIVYVMARFVTRPVSKQAAHFKTGQPVSKRVDLICDRGIIT